MSLILTFLGKGGTGRTTVAIASAIKFASLGESVLLVGLAPNPALGLLLGVNLTCEPQTIAPNLTVVQLESTTLLEQGWEQVKELESKYLRMPTLKNVYGQELGILPGMDQALALNALREYYKSGKYQVIIYDGSGDLTTLRMFGTPETMSWYIRRFGQVFSESDIGKTLSPFVQPVTSAVLNVSWNPDHLGSESTNPAKSTLEEGKEAVSNPQKMAAYLVTTDNHIAVATAKSLWGSSQQVGLTVGGVILNQAEVTEQIKQEFNPLGVTSLPRNTDLDWQLLSKALPDFKQASNAPKPIIIDTPARQVKVFLPGFDKKQVKLTQYGTEITIEAGDQRRNIVLPPPLTGANVKGAKFQQGYLIISL